MGSDTSHSPSLENAHSVESEHGVGNCCERGKGLVDHLGGVFRHFPFSSPLGKPSAWGGSQEAFWINTAFRIFFYRSFQSPAEILWSSPFSAYPFLLKLLSPPIFQMTTGANERYGVVNYIYYICICYDRACASTEHWQCPLQFSSCISDGTFYSAIYKAVMASIIHCQYSSS